MDVRIEVHGLSELRRALAQCEGRSPKEVAQANFEAADIVAREARSRAPSGPHEGSGTVTPIRASIKAMRRARAGVVAMGGARTPHAEPTEFGGTLARHASASRTRVRQRAFLYPAIEAKRGEVMDFYGNAVDRIMRPAFH